MATRRTAATPRCARSCLRAQCAPRLLQIVVGLQAHPEALAGAERGRQPDRAVGADAALAQHALVDAAWRHARGARQGVLADAQRGQELLQQDFLPGWMLGRRFMAARWVSGSRRFSTSSASPSFHWKHTGRCSLIRMLYWPLRFPFNASRRLAGGIRKSSSVTALRACAACAKSRPGYRPAIAGKACPARSFRLPCRRSSGSRGNHNAARHITRLVIAITCLLHRAG